MGRPVTIKDVAREAEVSTATVSLALRGSPRLSAATRERVVEVAARLGYRRNPAFAALGAMSHRHAASQQGVGVALVRQLSPTGHDYAMPQVVEGIRERAASLGYRLEDVLLDEHASPEVFFRQADARGMAGMIFFYLREPEILRSPRLERMALISAGVFRQPLPVNTVRASPFQRARQALLEVRARGYRRILVFQLWHRDSEMDDDIARLAGTMAAQHQIGAIRGGWVRVVDRPKASDVDGWRREIVPHRPDAVIGFNTADHRAVEAAGFNVPEKVGFAAQEAADYEARLSIASMTGAPAATGRAAIEWLDQLIRLGQLGLPELRSEMVMGSRWQEGETLPWRR